MPGVEVGQLARLAGYPFVVISWVDDAGYPLSVASSFEVDAAAGTVSLTAPVGDAVAVPTNREVNLLGSHIRPTPGQGYDERRYLQLWGRAGEPAAGRITFTPTRAWGWDEAEMPFFELAMSQIETSHLSRPMGESSKIVPFLTEYCFLQDLHFHTRRADTLPMRVLRPSPWGVRK